MATITARKADVYSEVNIITAYIGGKNGKYDTIPTLDADEPLLDVLWREAAAWAAAYIGASKVEAVTDTEICVDADNGSPIQACASLLRCALARHIISRWLGICGHESSESHLSQASAILSSLRLQSGMGYPLRRSVPAM